MVDFLDFHSKNNSFITNPIFSLYESPRRGIINPSPTTATKAVKHLNETNSKIIKQISEIMTYGLEEKKLTTLGFGWMA